MRKGSTGEADVIRLRRSLLALLRAESSLR